MTNDLDAYTTLPSHGRVRIMFEVISPTHIFVSGIFNTNDVEIDYAGLPLEQREQILQSCMDEVKKREQIN